MTKFEDNLSPYISFVEGAAPSSPAATNFRLYYDSSDHLLKWKNSAGSVTTIATGSPLTNPMTTRGDLIYENSSPAAARLAIGAAGKFLSSDGTDVAWGQGPLTTTGDVMLGATGGTPTRLALGAAGAALSRVNGAVAWNSGTSMPTGATGDRYWRTDLGMEFYYDGTRWVTTQLFTCSMEPNNWSASGATATTSGYYRIPVPPFLGGTDIWMVSDTVAFYVNGGTALGASHNWVGTFNKTDSAASDTAISTHTINSGSSSVYRSDTQAIGALLGATSFIFSTTWTKTGTPGNLIHFHVFSYRIVST